MMWLEQVGEYIHEVTHASTPQIVLDVIRTHPNKLIFKMSRGKKKVLIDVWLNEKETERIHIRGKRDVEDLADLKDCICAQLSSGVRMLNVLKSILKDHLKMRSIEEGNPQALLYVVPGDIELWFDEEDNILVKGGSYLSGIRTYVADDDDEDMPSTENHFYFENPFAVKSNPEQKHSLMPGTLYFLSDVLGSLGYDFLHEFGPKPEEEHPESTTQKEMELGVNLGGG